MEIITKFVKFEKYCKECKYEKIDESLSPCNECLAQGYNTNSHKPIYFKSKNNINKQEVEANKNTKEE